MFRQDDLHPTTGKYRHILMPSGAAPFKAKMSKERKPEVKTGPAAVTVAPSPYPRYRSDAGNE